MTVRTRTAVVCAAAAAAALLAYYLVAWAQVSPLRERGTDFSDSYVAAQLVRDGQGASLYDQRAEHARHLQQLPPGTVIDLPFITPPTSALLAMPFTLTDPGTAFRLWSLCQLALLALAIVIACRAAPWPRGMHSAVRWGAVALGLAGVATFSFLLLGQIDGVAALGLAAAYALWRRDRAGWAGFCLALGFASTKPHLAVGLAVFLVARRDWRAVAGAAMGVAAAVAASLLTAGPAALGGFVSSLIFALGNTPATSTVGTTGLAASWLGTGGGATAFGLAGSLVALAGCAVLGARSAGRPMRLEAALAGALALSLVASPHVLAHDLVLLAPAFGWCLARAAAADGAAAAWPGQAAGRLLTGWVGLNLLVDLDTGNSAPAPPGRLVPWALLLAGAAALVACGLRLPRTRLAELRLQSGSGSGAGGSSE